MNFNRRQLLKALGLGSLGTVMLGRRAAFAAPLEAPKRVVFFVQPHGYVPSGWKMAMPGAPTDRFAERSLARVPVEEFSHVLKPLYEHRQKILAIDGLAHTSVLADVIEAGRLRGDGNNHSLAVAGVLTGAYAAQKMGFAAAGGAISIDQEIAARGAGAGRFSSRVYGADYTPNSTVTAFSFLGASQTSPMVKESLTAFNDLLGNNKPVTPREAKLLGLRTSTLDTVSDEYRFLAPKLGAEGRRKLDQHHALIRDLEMSFAERPSCALTFEGGDHPIRQFMRLIRMAFACDLTRVVTFVAPVPQCPEFGYPAAANVHASYAHSSIAGASSCGQMYDPVSEKAMNDLGAWYAGHFAKLLTELDSVREGDGTMLDNTAVLWVSELATGAHHHHDTGAVLAGAARGFFKTGRYVRYPQNVVSPLPAMPRIGPGHNKLYVSLLQAMGHDVNSFGLEKVPGTDGSTISLSGALTELHA